MSLKRFKMIAVINVFLLCFLFHFIYSWFPNVIFSIIFPVNESIWEHMKLIISSLLIYGIFEFFLLKKHNIPFGNYITSIFISGTLGICIFLIVFLPLYKIFGENFILNIIVLFIVICICEAINYYVLKKPYYKYIEYVSLIGIVLIYVLFGILTYCPIINDLFYDKVSLKYGINTYNS